MSALRGFLAFALLIGVASAEEPQTAPATEAVQASPNGGAANETEATDPALPKEIPLDSIYALEMPGTKNVRDLEPDYLKQRLSEAELLERSAIEQIRRYLHGYNRRDRKAGPCFAIVGGLSEARDVLLGKQERKYIFSTKDDITLVFFSYLSGAYVHLDKVTVEPRDVKVHYHFARHSTMDMSQYFALIPLGKLPPNKYRVQIIQGPVVAADHLAHDAPLELRRVKQVICDSYAFMVRD